MTVATDMQVSAQTREQGYLHNRWVDFICLGGGSLPILCLLLLLPGQEFLPYTISVALLMSHFINNPHFAHSYQIFYSDFGSKSAPGAPLRARFLFAGIGVPVIIITYFLVAAIAGSPRMLGLAVNAMLFSVGWHYVKQGYGILMVESVIKRAFFNDREKAWLRYNALGIWILSWAFANRAFGQSDFFGLNYVTVPIPDMLFWAVAAGSAVTTIAVLAVLAVRMRRGPLPWNGVLAYATAAYVWLVLCQYDPILLTVVPLFHSLQYMAVVWRYQLNKEQADAANHGKVRLLGLVQLDGAHAAMIRFVWAAIMIGATCFWVVPLGLDAAIDYREDLFGASMFLGMVGVFINIHHYFLDNVMWRRENPDMKEHLFH